MPKTYFPGLNTIRLYAALSVVFYHFAGPAQWFGDAEFSDYHSPWGFLFGGDAVTLFFVLSGFLIIYLLLKEKGETGTVSTRRFYTRRIFRILPLYYLTFICGAIITVLMFNQLPADVQAESASPLTWISLTFFFFNFINVFKIVLGHLWSLNVEEQFYLFIPQLIKRFSNIPVMLISVIVLKLGLQFLMLFLWRTTDQPIFRYLFNVGDVVRFECMAIGGLGAYLVLRSSPALKWITHPVVRRLTIAAAAFIAFYGLWPQLGINLNLGGISWRGIAYNVAISVVFFSVIVNIAAAPKFLLRVESPLLRKLGDMSYGLYMWHPLVIWLVYFAGVRGIAYPVLIVAGTFIVAYLSHTYFETRFLKLRDRVTGERIVTPLPNPAPLS